MYNVYVDVCTDTHVCTDLYTDTYVCTDVCADACFNVRMYRFFACRCVYKCVLMCVQSVCRCVHNINNMTVIANVSMIGKPY